MIRVPQRVVLSGDADRDGQALQRALDAIVDSLSSIAGIPILRGNRLEGVVLVAGSNLVDHGLGRPLRGWEVVRRRADVRVWDAQDDNVNPERTLSLVSSGAGSVDLWVY